MRKRAKTITLPFPREAIALGILFFILSLFAALQAQGADKPKSCTTLDALKKEKTRQESYLNALRSNSSSGSEAMRAQISLKENTMIELDARISTTEIDCATDQAKVDRDQEKCKRSAETNPGLYDIDSDGTCTMKEVGTKANPNTGECNNAELLRGTNLKGEACKDTANTIKGVQAQQESIGAATTAAVQGYSSYQATMATGQQADAQMQQRKILQGLAVAKIATGALQMAGAAQLKSAAGNATAAASNISEAHKGLMQKCDSAAVKREGLSSEQCFYKNAKEFGITDSAQELANFERLKSAQVQSEEQATRANDMAKASMITGMADAFVGIQAMMMARQTQQQVDFMGAPPAAPIAGYNIGGASQGGLTPGGGATPGNAAGPTDFGDGSGPGTTLGGGGGPIGNGIKGGKGFAPTPGSKAEKSTVSTAGGGGGGGGGGGASRGGGGRKGGGPSNTSSAEFNLGGGGGGGFRGGSGPAEKGEGGNAFAEALAKLFPQDPNGKPVVESRQLASEGGGDMIDPDAYVGSDVEAVDVSLFEQVTAKYRQLAGNGSI
jgi:hypothetical protein